MDLQGIVDRYAAGLAAVDVSTATVVANTRTGEVYPLSVKSLRETQAVAEVDEWWERTYPDDFSPPPNMHQVGFPYSFAGACDHVFTTDSNGGKPEWALEVKKIEFVGNNGNNNDYGVAKALSPYWKDRSLIHDVGRLREEQIGRRQAAVAYTFRYSPDTCAKARALHADEQHQQWIANIEKVIRKNGGELAADPLIEFCEAFLRARGWVIGALSRRSFEAWRHPCAGEGVVFGWEISRPPRREHPV